jgi:hypothetical protein
MADEEGGSGGTLASNDELIAQYQTTRIRSFWAGYKRLALCIFNYGSCVEL